MPRYRVLPYKQGSRSARSLADAIGGRVLRLEGSTFNPRPDDVIINWGNTQAQLRVGVGFNFPGDALRTASNKLSFFQTMVENGHEDLMPPFWVNQEDIPDEEFPVVCRTVLSGHSGAGIVIANTRRDLVPAPLYVKYVKKQDEYRIHLGRRDGESIIIAQQRKARRNGFDNPNFQVRNHQNGFVYVREGVHPPECVLNCARTAFTATGLDFGAVDAIYNNRRSRAFILEINTAPGLEGTTINDYANFFRPGYIRQ